MRQAADGFEEEGYGRNAFEEQGCSKQCCIFFETTVK
jgi:hypothetical protein